MSMAKQLVRAHQGRLKSLGYAVGPVDGVAGRRTADATVAFKRRAGLRARAFVGPVTMKRLWADDAPRAVVAIVARAKAHPLPWMGFARETEGLHEVRDNRALRRALASMKAKIDPAQTAWCGGYVSDAFADGLPNEAQDFNTLGARQWLKFGRALEEPAYGCVVVFWRGSLAGWKGHVGFVVGVVRDANGVITHVDVLGGNQRNAVNVRRFKVGRVLGYRWPLSVPLPGRGTLSGAFERVQATDGDEA